MIKRYLGFLFQIFANKLGNKKLFSLSLDITDVCNGKCVFCGIWEKNQKFTLNLQSFETQLKSSRVLRNTRLFNIGGGEPFVDLELLEKTVLLIEKNAKPLQIRIVTNGTLPENIIHFFTRISSLIKIPIGLKISLDALGEEYHSLRGIPNGDKKIIQTIESLIMLSEKNLALKKMLFISIGFTATSKNLNQFNPIFQLAKKYKIGFFYKPVISGGCFQNASMNPALLIDIEKNKSLLLGFNKSIMVYYQNRPFIEKFTYRMFYKYFNMVLKQKKPNIICGALRSSVYIVPNGDIFSCLMDTTSLGNLNEADFDSLWKSDLFNRKRKEIKCCSCKELAPCDLIPSLYVDKILWALF